MTDAPEQIRHFFSLTPDTVLHSVERAGLYPTGVCYALNSLENRVYEIEVEEDDGSRRRLVGKFYRPGRWSKETILDEHRLLFALEEAEIPVCAPTRWEDGESLKQTDDGIFFALFPRVGGRSPDELREDEFEQLGRLLARIHNVSASLGLTHRPVLAPETYGEGCLEIIKDKATISAGVRARYIDAAEQLIAMAKPLFAGRESFPVHADCHRANLLRGSSGFFFLDFDDVASAPPVQDVWLLLPARAADCPRELNALLTGYEQFREFDNGSLRLIEALRGLRYIRYASWIVDRWDDPAFPRAFPQFGHDNYWEGQVVDLYDQIRQLQSQPDGYGN